MKSKKWLHKIDETSHRLIHLVSDFLDVSKIESGQITLVRQEIEPGRIIRETLESYLPHSRAYQGFLFFAIRQRPRYQIFMAIRDDSIRF